MNKKLYLIVPALALIAGVFAVRVSAARVEPNREPADVIPSNGHATVVIPEHAVEVAPGIFNLGTALYNGQVVEGYAHIHYKEGYGKPTECRNDGVCQGWEGPLCDDCAGGGGEDPEPDGSTCYGFLSKGAKWKAVEPYIVDPTNTRGLKADFISSNFASNIGKWENVADADILGDEIPGVVDGADLVSPDGDNEIYFGDIDESRAIAVTIIWGVFRGPPGSRELVEWDQVYDQVDYDWSGSGESGKMDFENIATHELGHSVGLDDLYEDACAEQTMYGYADYGETKKRDLEAGDIAGVYDLYN